MSDKSNIEWTDATWNPIVGCSIVSPGCTNCYAMKMAARIQKMNRTGGSSSNYVNHYDGTTQESKAGAVWTGKVALAPDKLFLKPLSWKTTRKIFVNSMGDLFHESIPDEWIDRVFALMALSRRHTFQILTKRAERMQNYVSNWFERIARSDQIFPHPAGATRISAMFDWAVMPAVLPNVWLGVSCERQQEADERIPPLLQTPAVVRFISAEPLLGPISLRWAKWDDWRDASGDRRRTVNHLDGARMLDWVIVGGESGPRSRPMHVEWADEIVDQCQEANVPCFVKQLGALPMSSGYPLELISHKGGEPAEWPDRLNVRQFPRSAASRSPVVSEPSSAEVIVP